MDVVPSKRLREIYEGDVQENDCFVSFKRPNPLPQIDTSPLVICYGALNDAAAQCLANKIAPEQLHLTNCNGYHRFPITFKDETYLLQSLENEHYAVLDTHSTRKLAVLSDLCSVRLEAITDTSNIVKRRNKKNRRQTFSVFIHIFGPQDAASDAASRLSKASAFLQHPKSLEPGMSYSNPQFFRVPGMDEDMNEYVGVGDRLSNQRKAIMSAEIHDIFFSLTRVESFQAGLPEGIRAILKPHQEDAFSFILQRETEAVCNNLQIGLQQIARVSSTQSTSYGGIIADVMGLGKTLTMLTAILHSLPPTCNFDKGDEIDMSTKTQTRATLVVVTSAQLIESWSAEIAKHFAPGYLSYMVFHGPKRTSNKNDLMLPSIVLTTYATVVADHEGFDVLGQMNWYRVVLDEAHWIRNPTSKQFRAVSSLTTNRRWCITGTPIQNKLEELASLASFLRLPPFSTRSTFHSNILLPLSQGGPDYARPLRAYLRAYCLRRTETHLNLPQSVEEIVCLSFSPEEANLYKAILKQSRREIDELVSSAANIRRYNILFTAILKMRMLCNRGTLSSTGRTAYLSPQKLSLKCGRCSEIGEDDGLLLESFSFCPDCDCPLHISSLGPNSRPSPISDGGMENDMISPDSAYSVEPHSTKLSSVVHNVCNYGTGTKHIVFSYWTSTLDALGQLFNAAGVCHIQIDGRTSYTERSNRLKNFRVDSRVIVLLMSIETGSVGLNLTAASVVHIVEPQWNPSVEEQAVARALRMGQTKEVKIFRYIMKGTVEENIIELQKKKRKLATFTFGEDDEGAQEKLEDLKFVLNADVDQMTTTTGVTQ